MKVIKNLSGKMLQANTAKNTKGRNQLVRADDPAQLIVRLTFKS
jgi:hypothetical protein